MKRLLCRLGFHRMYWRHALRMSMCRECFALKP